MHYENNHFVAVSLLEVWHSTPVPHSKQRLSDQCQNPQYHSPLTSCCTLLTVSHLACPVPLDRTQIQLTRKHCVTYLGNSQHTYVGARGGGTISRSQESSNDAAEALSEYSPVNLNKMVKYLFCKTLRKTHNQFPSYLLMACTGGVVAPDRRAQA